MSDAAVVNLRNWLELPADVTGSILSRLDPIEILVSAQYACSLWRNICKEPFMWRSIDMRSFPVWEQHLKKISVNAVDRSISMDMCRCSYNMWFPIRRKYLQKICIDAVDRSSGGLLEIDITDFCTDQLLFYISKKSVHLKRLRLAWCLSISDKGLSEAALNLPSLEELEISCPKVSKDALEIIGRHCPLLNSLRRLHCDDVGALAIAETMPGLRHLELVGNRLTKVGLEAILNGCPHLEYLDLSRCYNLVLRGDLQKRCVGSIKTLRQPPDQMRTILIT